MNNYNNINNIFRKNERATIFDFVNYILKALDFL